MNHEKLQTKLQEMIEGLGAALQETHPEMGERYTDSTILECSIPALATFLLEDNAAKGIEEHIAGSFSAVLTMPEVYEIMRPIFYETIYKALQFDELKTEEYAQFIALSTVVMSMNGMPSKSAFTIAMISCVADSKIK